MSYLKFKKVMPFLLVSFLLLFSSVADSQDSDRIYFQETIEFDEPGVQSRIITQDVVENHDDGMEIIQENSIGVNFTLVILHNETVSVKSNYLEYNFSRSKYILEENFEESPSIYTGYPYTANGILENGTPLGTENDDPFTFKMVLYYNGTGSGKIDITIKYLLVIATPDNQNGFLNFVPLFSFVPLVLIRKVHNIRRTN